MKYFSLFLLILLVALQVADAYLTWRVLAAGGRELNPVVRFLIGRLGLVPGLAVAKLTLTILSVLFLFDQPLVLLGAVGLYVWVVDHNIKQLYRGGKA